MTIQNLWDDFAKLTKNTQIEILKKYTYYVANFDFDMGQPVSFLEWWTNDFEEEV